MNICVIPAKATSTRIPNKNIKPFCGKPVILYTLEAVNESGLFDKIVVSTDSDEIGALAARNGAVYFKRGDAFAQADSPMVDAVLEVLAEETEEWDTACMAYACSPFITADILKGAYSVHDYHEAEVTTSVYRSAEHAEYSMLLNGALLQYRYPEFKDVNSNHFPATYQNAGQLFIANVEHLKMSRTFVPANLCGYIVPFGVDIDTPADWAFAEVRYLMENRRDLIDWALENSSLVGQFQTMQGTGNITLNYQDSVLASIERNILANDYAGE